MTTLPGLYIHVPFCARRCPYCDFYSISALDLIPRYMESLAIEAHLMAPKWTKPFETLYIGGGSPSLLTKDGLKKLWEALNVFDLSQLKEITLEANPEDVNQSQAELWAEMGVTRLSLGLQSLDERWLGEVLGRGHSVQDSLEVVKLLKEQPYALSFDLIYGLPSQRLEDWGEDLTKAVELAPDHISAYSLTLTPGTALTRSVSERLLPPPPAADKMADFFLLTAQALKAGGFHQYEVSNFARPGFESQHNLKYWRREPYLGLGPAAHSFDGTSRWGNVPSVRQWMSALSSKALPQAFEEVIDDKAAQLEEVMLGLRLPEGVREEVLINAPRLKEFIESGHLIHSEGRIRPTEKGILVADRLAVELTD